MNRIVLVGNGFDLAHGLPTKYEDFINWYRKGWVDKLSYSNKHKESDDLCTFKLGGKMTFQTLFFTKDQNIQVKNVFETPKTFSDSFVLEPTRFFDKICKAIEIKKWVDIECEYYKFLCSFLGNTSPYVEPKILNKELDFIKLRLIEYLNPIQEKEVQNLHLKDNIKREILSSFTSNDISVSAQGGWISFIKDRCNLEKNDWIRLLHSYGKNYISNRCEKINSFQEYCKEINKTNKIKYIPEEEFPEDFLLPNKIMLLNFNYTTTADAYLPKADCFTVNHIHGKLSEPESVIFGYGDELDESYKKLLKLDENEYLRNIKSIRYLESDNYRKMLSFIESAPYQVCIMGHSCGNSDRTLLNTLFEHKNCASIKPFYYRKRDGLDNYLEIVQNICRNFTDMKLMRDRVVNKTYCTFLS